MINIDEVIKRLQELKEKHPTAVVNLRTTEDLYVDERLNKLEPNVEIAIDINIQWL